MHYAVVFLVIALVAALFGFGGIAASATGVARVLCFAFLLGAVLSFFRSLAAGNRAAAGQSRRTLDERSIDG
jgi:uncharacterized membrane protein YtjA (UPF0391 family)